MSSEEILRAALENIKLMWAMSKVQWNYEINVRDDMRGKEIRIRCGTVHKVTIFVESYMGPGTIEELWNRALIVICSYGFADCYRTTVLMHRNKSFAISDESIGQMPATINECTKEKPDNETTAT